MPLSGAVATQTRFTAPFLGTVSGTAVRLVMIGPVATCTITVFLTRTPGLPSVTPQAIVYVPVDSGAIQTALAPPAVIVLPAGADQLYVSPSPSSSAAEQKTEDSAPVETIVG